MDTFDHIPEPDRNAWYVDCGHDTFGRPEPIPAGETVTDPAERIADERWDDVILAILMSETDEPVDFNRP